MTLKSSLSAFAMTSILLTACQSQPIEPAHEWGVKAQSDLTIAHNMMLESHPGPVDTENPGFNKQAQSAYDHAMKLAVDVTDQPGYAATLLAYTAGFRDGHFGLYPNSEITEKIVTDWPGMVPSWRADKVRIIATDEAENKFLGTELLSCDGQDINQLILDNVFQFDSAKPDQDAYWARKAHAVLLNNGNPLIKRPENCEFKLPSGERFDHALNWRPAPDIVFNTYRWKSSFGLRPDIGMDEIRPGHFWINLPDFSPNKDDAEKIRTMFAEVIERRDEIRNAKSLVFDMRGNQGGSSAWGVEMAKALWGEDYFESLQTGEEDTYVEWRLSKENVDYMDWIVNYLLENGHTDMAENYFRPIKEGAEAAFAEGRAMYLEPDFDDEDDANTDVRTDVANPVKTPVFVLSHGTCASACLDFLDIVLSIDGVTHIGYPTSSDTNYMEVRMVDLPSKNAKIVIPTKVYRNRMRASGEAYEPEFRYDGFDWSDEAIKAWAQQITAGNP